MSGKGPLTTRQTGPAELMAAPSWAYLAARPASTREPRRAAAHAGHRQAKEGHELVEQAVGGAGSTP